MANQDVQAAYAAFRAAYAVANAANDVYAYRGSPSEAIQAAYDVAWRYEKEYQSLLEASQERQSVSEQG